ncbi:MAG: zinc-dependent metalloprotease family protein [Planctomycetia bacterium]|nr:zinc-dependent metalloprotease family protein [Planctomycetia bacterium]
MLGMERLENRDLLAVCVGEVDFSILENEEFLEANAVLSSPVGSSEMADLSLLESAAANPTTVINGPKWTSDIDVFNLNSLAGASLTIYLDFTGHTTTGTSWNSSYNSNNPIITPVFSIDSDPTFNDAEKAAIYDIWQRVSEDYLPFNVNVSTAEPTLDALIRTDSSDTVYGIRVCIGGSYSDWYKHSAGGVAYIGSFTYLSDTPCFIFSDGFKFSSGWNTKMLSESLTHEVGHSLGLRHDGTLVGSTKTEYYTGTELWAPIMGTGYYSRLTQWSKGEYANAAVINNGTQIPDGEDDIAVLTNRLGLRADDYSDSIDDSFALGALSTDTAISGMIGTCTDVDYFSFSTDLLSGGLLIGGYSGITNLDVLVKLYNSDKELIETYDPSETFYVLMDLSDLSGSYYISVEGIGWGDPLTGGYSDYGSLGAYTITVVSDQLPDLKFYQASGAPAAVYLYTADEPNIVKTVFASNETIFLSICWINDGSEGINAGSYTLSAYLDHSRDYLFKAPVSSNPYGKAYFIHNSDYFDLGNGSHTVNFYLDYDSTVAESDETNNFYTVSFTICDPWEMSSSFADNQIEDDKVAYGEVVGTFTTSDEMNGSSFVYTLTDNAETNNGFFEIVDNELQIIDPALSAGTYRIEVNTRAAEGYSRTEEFTFTVYLSADMSVSNDNPDLGTWTFLSATTRSAKETISWLWDLSGTGNGDFTVRSDGASSFWLNTLDYKAFCDSSAVIRVQAQDADGNLSKIQTVDLNIVNPIPIILFDSYTFANNTVLKLNINVKMDVGSVKKWTVQWGDGKKSDPELCSSFLKVAHYYGDYTEISSGVSLTLELANEKVYTYYLRDIPVSLNGSNSPVPAVADSIYEQESSLIDSPLLESSLAASSLPEEAVLKTGSSLYDEIAWFVLEESDKKKRSMFESD